MGVPARLASNRNEIREFSEFSEFSEIHEFSEFDIGAKPLKNLQTGTIPDRDFFLCSITISDSELYKFLSHS